MNLSRYITVLALALPLQACALFPLELSSGPVVGVVVEDQTQQPIEGAIVEVRWIGRVTSGISGRDTCYHVETATTDAQGRYITKAWSQRQQKDFTVRPDHVTATAYKPGYGFSKRASQVGETVILAQFKGTPTERFEYLGRVISGTSCRSAGESYVNLYRITYAVYEEAKSIAQTAEQERQAERYRELAEETLVDRSKPTMYDERGRLINVNPQDTFRVQDLK